MKKVSLIPPIFQFHKGTIRTQFLVDLRLKQKQFQFHKGTIRTYYVIDDDFVDKNFNSIKVQLEQPISQL